MVKQYKDAHTMLVTTWLDDLLSIQASFEASRSSPGGVDDTGLASIEHLAERVQDYLHAYRSRRESQEEEELGRRGG